MRTRNRTHQSATPIDPARGTELPAGCRPCAAGDHHCHGTLVLHADGGAECDEAATCETREDLHEWWIACVDLGCGCTGDEQDRPQLLLAA